MKVEAATQTFATITLQNYFRMHHKLAGMTGTAETQRPGEFWDIYKLDVVTIPTNRPVARIDMNDRVYKTKKGEICRSDRRDRHACGEGRPVLVGTTSVRSRAAQRVCRHAPHSLSTCSTPSFTRRRPTSWPSPARPAL